MRPLKFVFSNFFICISLIAALIAAIIFLCFYIHSLLPAAAAIALAYIFSAVAVGVLLCNDSPADFKCAWLVFIVALPVAGAVLYFISLISRKRVKEFSPSFPPCGCDGYEYFTDGATFLNRLITLVSSAKKCVYLEFYIISKGHIWGVMKKELLSALARGAEVKIIYDGLGSALRAPKKDLKEIERAGGKVMAFNKLLPLPVSRLNFRDHRKIAAIDGDAVMLGGVNIADEYANITSPHGYWKDGGALFYGQIAEVYSQIFLSAFNRQEKFVPHMPAHESALSVIPIADEPEKRDAVYEDALAAAIYSAKRRVYIFTPYLCAGDKLSSALLFAARRGAEVKIIIPAIPDKKLTYAISRSYCQSLIEGGVKIYVYTPGFMHFKGVVCDDGGFVGSYNFDYRSMRLNYECGIYSEGQFAEEIAIDFENCLALSRPLQPSKKGRGKLTRAVLHLFAPLV